MATTLNKATRILWLLLEFPALFLLDYYFMNLPLLHFGLVVLLLCFSHIKSFRIGARVGYNIAADANKEQK